jgi:hypothetical protein
VLVWSLSSPGENQLQFFPMLRNVLVRNVLVLLGNVLLKNVLVMDENILMAMMLTLGLVSYKSWKKIRCDFFLMFQQGIWVRVS